MTLTRFPRELALVKGNVFIICPFGKKVLRAGEQPHDFDAVVRAVINPVVEELGMTPVRADSIYGGPQVMDNVWRGIQQAELIVVDFSGKAPNVAFEYGLAAMIGKRMVFLTQDKADIPSDLAGLRYITYSNDFLDMKNMSAELAAQLTAVREEPPVELGFTNFGQAATEPAPGYVHSVQQELVTVRTDDGDRYGVLGRADVDWGRLIPDMRTRFKVGDRVDGAFDTKSMKYTLLAGQTNPWPAIESEYQVGHKFTGVVQNKLTGGGVFVKVSGPVKGLLPLNCGPEVAELDRGDEVEVVVTRVDVHERRVQLRLARRMEPVQRPPAAASPPEIDESIVPGLRIEDAEVVKVAPQGQGRGGFVLVKASPSDSRAMILHFTKMSPELLRDFNAGEVEVGELLTVVVDEVDSQRGKIKVHDIPDLEDEEASVA